MSLPTIQDREAYQDWTLNIVSQTISQIAVVSDAKSYLLRLARDEAGFARALNVADITVCLKNILGDKPRIELSDWVAECSGNGFELRRNVPWDNEQKNDISVAEKEESLGDRENETSAELFGVDHLRHKDRRVMSLINIPLWDKAK